LSSSRQESGKKGTIYHTLMTPGFPMLQVSNFDGLRLCSVKMDVAFKDIQMPDKATGQCQDGFRMCPELA
jgi:hypothetical protein